MNTIVKIGDKTLTINEQQYKNINSKIENLFIDKKFIHLQDYILKNINIEFPLLFKENYDRKFYIDLFLSDYSKSIFEDFFKYKNKAELISKESIKEKLKNSINIILLSHNDDNSENIKFIMINILCMLFLKSTTINKNNYFDGGSLLYSSDGKAINKFIKIIKNISNNETFKEINKKYGLAINLLGNSEFTNEINYHINKLKREDINSKNEKLIKTHMKNINNLFSKKMEYFIYINLLTNSSMFNKKLKLTNIYKYVDEIENVVNEKFYLALNTLSIYPFYGKKHFEIVKEKMKQDYGINNKGWDNLRKIKINDFSILFSNYSLFPIDLNTLDEEQNIEFKNINKKIDHNEYLGFKNMKNNLFSIDEYIKKVTTCLSNFINNKPLRIDKESINLEVESLIFKDFFMNNTKNAIFYRNKNKNKLMFTDNDFYYNNENRSEAINNLNYTKLNCLIFKNIKREGFYLYEGVDKLFLPEYNNIIYDDKFCFELFLNIIKHYFEVNKNNGNILFLLKFLINCLEDYELINQVEDEDFIKNINQLDKSDEILSSKIIELYNRVFEFLKINNNIEGRYSFIDMSFFIIERLTGVKIYSYYSGLQFQSFCIELYLVNLFEKHYNIKFDEKNKNHMKFISKLVERNFKNYEILAKKSFDYFDLKYKEYLYEKENVNDFNLLNKITTFKDEHFIINDFKFKPMVNKIELIRNGIKMKNCLRNNYNYKCLEQNTIVWLVTNSKNEKFRVNFELLIEEEDLYVKKILTYCNKENEIMKEEFENAFSIFKKTFFGKYNIKNYYNR